MATFFRMAMEVLLIDVALDLHVCFTKSRQLIYSPPFIFSRTSLKVICVTFVTVAQFLNARTLEG
jgi:hypothetical protein